MENKVLNANLNAIKRYDKSLADEILRINNIKSTFELVENKKDEQTDLQLQKAIEMVK